MIFQSILKRFLVFGILLALLIVVLPGFVLAGLDPDTEFYVPEPQDGAEEQIEDLEDAFVVDTSRNGQGPWTPPAGYPDPQDWCNPPDRGLGLLPTVNTGHPLNDAFLWVKIPGASDGECTRGLGPAGGTIDPEWGIIDPAAGDWFPEMAIDLVLNANPPLEDD